MSYRNLVILTKIILFYSLFYAFLKLVVIIRGGWLWPNLLLVMPFFILFAFGLKQVRNETYSWFFVTLGAAVIVLVRIYEAQLVYWLQQEIG